MYLKSSLKQLKEISPPPPITITKQIKIVSVCFPCLQRPICCTDYVRKINSFLHASKLKVKFNLTIFFTRKVLSTYINKVFLFCFFFYMYSTDVNDSRLLSQYENKGHACIHFYTIGHYTQSFVINTQRIMITMKRLPIRSYLVLNTFWTLFFSFAKDIRKPTCFYLKCHSQMNGKEANHC